MPAIEEFAATLVPRQYFYRSNCTRTEDGFIDENSCYVPFWYTKTGMIVKWSLFLGLILLIIGYLLFGYLHAKKRMRQGLAPLGYHRWLVPRSRRGPTMNPRYQYPGAETSPYYANGQNMGMYGMAPPPPMYDPNAPRPPMYPGPPPDGATKTDPSQQGPSQGAFAASADYMAPPPGPPPPQANNNALPTQNTGSSNPFRPL